MRYIVLVLAACGSPVVDTATLSTATTSIEQRVCKKADVCQVADFNNDVCQKCVHDAMERNPSMPVESLLDSATCEDITAVAEAAELIDCVRPDYIVDFTK